MGRFILSNNKEKHDEAVEKFQDGGLEKNIHIITDEFNFTSFKKVVDNENRNSVKFDNGDFICLTGTFIYDRRTGIDAIKDIYSAFSNNISELQNEIIGSYGCVLKKNDTIYVFSDGGGIYNIYFTKKSDDIIISQDYHKISYVINNKSVNEMTLLERSFQFSNLDNETIFRKIKLLPMENYLESDLNRNKMEIHQLSPDNKPDNRVIERKDIDSMAQELSDLIKKYARLVADAFQDIKICMTGGLDSRLLLAAFLSIGVKPELIYGIGNSGLTNTKWEDLAINQIYAERYGLNLTTLDWSINDILGNEDRDYLLNRYGQYSYIYGGKGARSFENVSDNNSIFLLGFGGERYRNVQWLDDYQKNSFDLDTFIQNYIYDHAQSPIINYKGYTNYIKEKYIKIIKSFEIDECNIKKDDFQQLHDFYRRSADTVLNNHLNLIARSINLSFIPEISNYISQVPAKYKENSRFQLELIRNFYPDLLNVPLFSHCQKMIIDEKKMKIKKEPYKWFIEYRHSENFLKNSIRMFFASLKKILYKKSIDKKNNKLKRSVKKQIIQFQNDLNLRLVDPNEISSSNLVPLYYYLHYLYLIYHAKNSL